MSKKKIPNQQNLIQQLLQETINCMIAVTEAFDNYTRDHAYNVARYAQLLAQELNLSKQQSELIYYGGLFHDIGKIGIAPEIIKKRGPLTKKERIIIEQHPEKGAHIISQISSFAPFVPLILYHHEHFDGSGYPEGLKAYDIPLGARIIAVADTFDAITTTRPYRKAQNRKKAIAEITKNAEKQFDPDIVAAFIKIAKDL